MDLDRTGVVVALRGSAAVRAAGGAGGERAVVVVDEYLREMCLQLGCEFAEGAGEGSVLGCQGVEEAEERGAMRVRWGLV